MSTVTTTRRIDLARLDTELGSVGLRMTGDGDTDENKTITAPASVTQPALQAAVDAHVWVDQDANRATIEDAAQSHLSDLRTLARSSGALSNTQRDNALRVIAKALILVIRLLLRQLDATD